MRTPRPVEAADEEMDLAAVVPVGLEEVAAAEMRGLGLRLGEILENQGLVSWRGTRRDLFVAHLRLRTVERIVVRLGCFRAQGFAEFRRKARRLPWERFVCAGEPVRLRAISRASRLYHEGALEERLRGAIADRLGGSIREASAGKSTPLEAALVLLRVHKNLCEMSIDASGELLHRRGYRLGTAKAPLRPTLAAAILRWAGWEAGLPLADPFCGAGTIPIEAASMAGGLAAGAGRSFAFERWPCVDLAAWTSVLEAESSPFQSPPAPIHGSDRDAGAIRVARDNARRAGVVEHVRFERRSISEFRPMGDRPGCIVTNPPYGRRLDGPGDLRDLYARLGQVLRIGFGGWSVTMLCPSGELAAAVELPWRSGPWIDNGGLKVRLLRCELP
jgi:putative N6-adenine-specific DNA methylase